MREHHLKIYNKYFDAVVDGSKTFEIRENDRNFQVGDVLVLIEIDETRKATGNSIVKEVTYLTNFMQRENYVVLGIAKPKLSTLQKKYSRNKALLLMEEYDWKTVRKLSEEKAAQEVSFWEYGTDTWDGEDNDSD